MDVKKYLERIAFRGNPAPDVDTLFRLHKSHLFSVPFENLDIHIGRKITLDIEKFYDKIVLNKRGGFCYELNGLFYALLVQLGFDVMMVSARVAGSKVAFGKDFDHMALIVNLKDQWLVDVGFGDSFILPVRLQAGLPQRQYGFFYTISAYDEDGYLKLSRSPENIEFKDQYIFKLKERSLEEFSEMCVYNQTSPTTMFTQKRICTLAAEDGRYTLSDLKFIITKDGAKEETILNNEEEFTNTLKRYFNIVL